MWKAEHFDLSDLGHLQHTDRGLRKLNKLRTICEKKKLTRDDLLADIMALLEQIHTIEHCQDKDVIDKIDKRYGRPYNE